ncbi:MAG: hypothetical protein IPK19_41395 [Chloroflexi bacterium]|nr:hypothetical protein [Chloroflexota bacterium]
MSGVFVSLLRLENDTFNHEDRAETLRREDPLVGKAVEILTRRAGLITERQEVADDVHNMLNARLDEWIYRSRLPSHLTYSTKRGDRIPLLTRPEDRDGDWRIFTTLNSMRDVERAYPPHSGRLPNG